MKVLNIFNQKGGAGKTTTATALGVALENQGFGPVVFIDMDTQKSLEKWAEARTAETPAYVRGAVKTLPELVQALDKKGYAVAIIDNPANLEDAPKAGLSVADLALIPVTPSPLDLRAVGPAIAMAKAHKVPFAFILSRAKLRTRLATNALMHLSQHGPVVATFGDLQDYPVAMIDGRVANELPRSTAIEQVDTLAQYVISTLSLKKAK